MRAVCRSDALEESCFRREPRRLRSDSAVKMRRLLTADTVARIVARAASAASLSATALDCSADLASEEEPRLFPQGPLGRTPAEEETLAAEAGPPPEELVGLVKLVNALSASGSEVVRCRRR